MWIGDPEKRNVANPERDALLKQRAELVKQITDLKAAPLPKGDTQLMQKFRMKDLTELAAKVVKIDQKLGRIK